MSVVELVYTSDWGAHDHSAMLPKPDADFTRYGLVNEKLIAGSSPVTHE